MKKYQLLYNNIHRDISAGNLLPGMKLPTEASLAEQYGISRQTVRKALNQLQQGGLIYSIQGSGSFVAYPRLNPANGKHIAVITTYFSEYIFPAILWGVNDVSFSNGYTLEVHTTNNSISVERSILENLQINPVAGIIVEGTKSALPNPNINYYKQLSQSGIPIVFINSIYPQLEGQKGIISIRVDDYNGGYQLAKKLIDAGYRDIGCIFKSDDAQGINRFSGMMDSLIANDVRFDDRNFIWYTTENKQSFLQSFASDGICRDCTGIICYNDEITAQVAAYLKNKEHKIKFIASFDDKLDLNILPEGIEFCSLSHPKKQLGRLAASKLLNMLSGVDEDSVIMQWGGCTVYGKNEQH